MIDFNIPWPEESNTLFYKRDGSEALIAGLTRSFLNFAEAYKDAADILVEKSLELPGFERDRQAFPIIFLYRQ